VEAAVRDLMLALPCTATLAGVTDLDLVVDGCEGGDFRAEGCDP